MIAFVLARVVRFWLFFCRGKVPSIRYLTVFLRLILGVTTSSDHDAQALGRIAPWKPGIEKRRVTPV